MEHDLGGPVLISDVFLPDTKTSITYIHSNHSPVIIKSTKQSDVLKSISALPSKECNGDDLILSYVIKDCKYVLVKSLTTIINLALTTGVFPTIWEKTRIVPALQKCDASDI
ncbi:hypothetical protein Trydic_g21885 [Trypoxylus dichotomus]